MRPGEWLDLTSVVPRMALLAGLIVEGRTCSDEWRFDELHPEAYRTLVEGGPGDPLHRPARRGSTNLYTSPMVEELLGFTVEEWVTTPTCGTRQLAPRRPRRRDGGEPILERTGEHFVRGIPAPRTKDGRMAWIRDEAAPMRDERATLVFWRA